ncbi:superoxide dismutase, Fe-Mn family [Oceanobacillus limi]|uniref:superoxide dismutase n=1 Tax=Oceanobacillus limi TaxID=930131 RepID=A0A1I0FMK3_9BACI|nr:superoxide dismutase [Oceanobacillus limi]SET58786.1 superoxide dismutase, Fe-Mn family [Oceanobacillus limi]
MDTNKQSYLESLIAWGEQMKDTLTQHDVPETDLQRWIEQINSWQLTIKDKLDKNEDNSEEMHRIQSEGERILSDIKGKKANDITSISYGEHKLPPLPYDYDALEPYINEEIMRLHHDRHHQSYVDGLNKAEKALYTAKESKAPIKHWLREQAFNGSGHYLHTIFWDNMTPNSTKRPSGEILGQLEKDFGSWKKFKELFSDVANSVEGNGWAVLFWAPRSGKLGIQSFEKHQLFQVPDTIPLLVLDVWEHAYYLQYKNDKASYVKNWWNVVNWDNVNKRFMEAKKLKWKLY